MASTALTYYTDSGCKERAHFDTDEYTTTLRTLQSAAKSDNLYYQIGEKCFECNVKEDGFHLQHMDKYFKCSNENSSVASCIMGEESANMANMKRTHDPGIFKFYEMTKAATHQ